MMNTGFTKRDIGHVRVYFIDVDVNGGVKRGV